MTKLSRPIFSRADVRFFDRADVEKAWKWIYEGLLQERPLAAPA